MPFEVKNPLAASVVTVNNKAERLGSLHRDVVGKIVLELETQAKYLLSAYGIPSEEADWNLVQQDSVEVDEMYALYYLPSVNPGTFFYVAEEGKRGVFVGDIGDSTVGFDITNAEDELTNGRYAPLDFVDGRYRYFNEQAHVAIYTPISEYVGRWEIYTELEGDLVYYDDNNGGWSYPWSHEIQWKLASDDSDSELVTTRNPVGDPNAWVLWEPLTLANILNRLEVDESGKISNEYLEGARTDDEFVTAVAASREFNLYGVYTSLNFSENHYINVGPASHVFKASPVGINEVQLGDDFEESISNLAASMESFGTASLELFDDWFIRITAAVPGGEGNDLVVSSNISGFGGDQHLEDGEDSSAGIGQFVGHLLRAGETAPYAWYKWNGTMWEYQYAGIVSADISDATADAIPGMVVKRDGSGGASFGQSDGSGGVSVVGVDGYARWGGSDAAMILYWKPDAGAERPGFIFDMASNFQVGITNELLTANRNYRTPNASGTLGLEVEIDSAVSGTTYTVDADDFRRFKVFSNAAGCAITVPTSLGSGNEEIFLHREPAAGALTLSHAGVTIDNGAAISTVAAGGTCCLKRKATNHWILI
jgi:hypothetical protein